MQQSNSQKAISALDAKLSKLERYGQGDDVEELRIELRWMKCFLFEGQRTAQGRAIADFWSSVIEQHAVDALNENAYHCYPVDYTVRRFAKLREKLQPFITCLWHRP
ncbi:unnamed protein product [Cuscuta europaea]|uniref:Uncharacterized protein n=1 Tax=Cuscuta europaea TaxID=41803 RepID=A0A9P0ZJE9_CUSEU|nr:unnamed protein product [Cuscuta europaea]